MFHRCLTLVASLSLGAATTAGAQSNNGVYGGYVGSHDWFRSMTRDARNQAMLRSLGAAPGATGDIQLPPGYIQIAGEFTFPAGNPFPAGRLPDLRIKCANAAADSVERAPFIITQGGAPSYYTVLKTGQTYAFTWMYYFGSKQQFATWQAPANAPSALRLVIAIDRKGNGSIENASAVTGASTVATAAQTAAIPKPTAPASPIAGEYVCKTAPGGCQTHQAIEIGADGSWSWGGYRGAYSINGRALKFSGPSGGPPGWGAVEIVDGAIVFHSQWGPSE